MVIVKDILKEEGGAFVAGSVASGVGPFPGDGLDETFGFAVGLGAVGSGKAMFEAELLAGLGEGVGAVAGATISHDGLGRDAMEAIEGDGLVECIEDTGDFFVGMHAGEGDATVVVDRDMQRLDPGLFITVSPVAGASDSGPPEPAQFLDVEMDKLSRPFLLVAHDRWWSRIKAFEPVQPVPAQYPRERRLGDRHQHQDLRVGASLSPEFHHLGFTLLTGSPRLMDRRAGPRIKPLSQPFFLRPLHPAAGRSFADCPGRCCGPDSQPFHYDQTSEFRSHQGR